MENCIFCKIVRGELPSYKVYEDDSALAFLDIHPVNIGHTLVIPKAHYPDILTTPEDVMARLMTIVKKVSHGVESLAPDGINISMNNREAAGQVIFHSHIHVIPRYKADGFEMWHGRRGYNDGEAAETAEKIKRVL